MTAAPTLSLAEARRRTWDVVVVGAGPAGSLAAHELSRAGRHVLLVDRADFPRGKVCGSCLNGRALGALQAAGLGMLVQQLGAVPVRSAFLAAPKVAARLSLPAGAAVSRLAFDTELVRSAIRRGSHFMPRTQAALGPVAGGSREVVLHANGVAETVAARVVLAADGLGGRLLAGAGEGLAPAAPGSHVGAGVLVDAGPAFFAPGTIYLACGESGYVGLVRVEDGRLDVAAALDPRQVRGAGGPGHVAAEILRQADLPAIAGLAELPWRGTQPLTRRAERLAAERVFVLGDAAGYVEPFTGEGMAWALTSARALAPVAARAVDAWTPSLARQWQAIHRRNVGRHQRWCGLLTGLLRRPLLTRFLIEVLARAPILAGSWVRRLNEPALRRGAGC